MAIDIVIVKEDLNTVVQVIDSIDITHDFYTLRTRARELKCVLMATIDDAGDTIINRLQIPFFLEEINIMRIHPDIDYKILDVIENALKNAYEKGPHYYIKFVGD